MTPETIKAGSEAADSPSPPHATPPHLIRANLALRFLLFTTTTAAIIVMATDKQTKELLQSFVLVAKFSYSPAMIYFVAANSIACFYSFVTMIISVARYSKSRILFLLNFLDSLIFGVVASGVGAVAAIGYVGIFGNNHVGWMKFCNVFDRFCVQAVASLILSVASSVIFIVLVFISAYSLHRRSLL